MRYYVVDNEGNVWGDFGDKKVAEIKLSDWLKEDKNNEHELEIIEAEG